LKEKPNEAQSMNFFPHFFGTIWAKFNKYLPYFIFIFISDFELQKKALSHSSPPQ